jgi:hypothetical protein
MFLSSFKVLNLEPLMAIETIQYVSELSVEMYIYNYGTKIIEKNIKFDGRIILRRIIRKWDVGVLTGLSWPTIETVGVHL